MSSSDLIDTLKNADTVYIEKIASSIPKKSVIVTEFDDNFFMHFGIEVDDKFGNRALHLSRKNLDIKQKNNIEIKIDNSTLLKKNVLKNRTTMCRDFQSGFEYLKIFGCINYFTDDGIFINYFIDYDEYGSLCLKSATYRCS